jgi:hypothetical protein
MAKRGRRRQVLESTAVAIISIAIGTSSRITKMATTKGSRTGRNKAGKFVSEAIISN